MNLEAELDRVEGFERGESIFSSEDDPEPAWFCNGKQAANLGRDHGQVELRATRAVIRDHRAAWKADPRVRLYRSGADWVGLTIESDDDLPLLHEVAALTAAQYPPAPGEMPKGPPTGADLARRRRFH